MSKHRPKRLDDIENIYKDYESRFERGRSGFGRILILLLFFICIIGLTIYAGHYVFREPMQEDFKEGEVTLEIKGNETASSGEEVFYVVDYQNKSSVDILNIDIQVSYPEGFIIKKVEPAPVDEQHNIWHLDKIASSNGGQIKIQAIVIGDVGDEKEIKANVKYNPTNTSAYFTKKADFNLFIEDLQLDFSIDSANNFKQGEKNNVNIKYVNNSHNELSNVKFIVFYPKSGVLFADEEEYKTNLPIEAGMKQYVKDIEKIGAKETGEINVSIIPPQVNSGKDFELLKVQLGYVNEKGEFIRQNEKVKNFFILKEEIVLQLLINGFNEQGFMDMSDKLNYSLICKNGGNAALENASIRVFIDDNNNLLNWSSLNLGGRGAMENKEIFWDSKTIPELALIEPQKEIELKFAIDVKEKKDINSLGMVDSSLMNWAEIIMGTGKTAKSNLVNMKLNTPLHFETELKYSGAGYLPPKAGETTIYKIYWRIKSGLHDAKNIEIKSKLQDNVVWAENTSVDSGEIYFEPKTKNVIWRIPKLPSDLDKMLEGNFEVSIKPSVDEVGKSMMVLGEISLSGTDNLTGGSLGANYNFLTTNDVVAE